MTSSIGSPLDLLAASGVVFSSVPPVQSAGAAKVNAAVQRLIGARRATKLGGEHYGFQAEEQFVEAETSEVNQPGDPEVAMRIVKVYIADVNENLPLASRIVYEGKEKLTDLTDQELFFDANITELLGRHNDVRSRTVDKAASQKFGRDIFLEPAKIRDLKMVVVAVAVFKE